MKKILKSFISKAVGLGSLLLSIDGNSRKNALVL